MGCCLSKNDPCSQSVPSLSQAQQNDSKKFQKLSAPVKVEHTKKQVAAFETNPKEENISEEREEEEEGKQVHYPKKKEVFVIQPRNSNDKRSGGPDSDGSASNSSNSGDPNQETEKVGRNIMTAAANGQAVRTSSCTKEEVDAILIQCGRLSRSSSGKGSGNAGNGNVGHGRRYSGSKRSFDFDRENEIVDDCRRKGKGNGNEGLVEVDYDDERSRRRQSRGSHRRRTTPSRSREREQLQQQQRSGSRERSQSNGRRVSRSPNRRSESPMNGSSSGSGNGNARPGKLVSVPATVSSLSMEKINNGNGGDGGNGNGNVKRVLVKRNAGSPRSQSPARAHSPVRAHSPARGGNQGTGNGTAGNGGNGGGQQLASLSRNGSRRAEHSPHRRTPLNEIDVNSLPFHPLSNKKAAKGKEIEEDVVVVKQPILSESQQNKFAETNNGKPYAQGTHRRTSSRGAESYEVTKTNYCRVNELQTPNVEQMAEDKRQQLDAAEYDAMVTPVVVSGSDTLKLPQTLMRCRSARRSRDLDINVEALLAPTAPTSTPIAQNSTPIPATNYNSLLLQDIQNFHQKKNSNANANANASSSNNNAAVSSNNDAANNPSTVPPCLSKACSILEAVADLNSTTGSNLSSLPYADERRKAQRENNFSYHNGNKTADSKDPFVESEVKVGDDLMEPSMHKYVTVRTKGGDFNDEESSGSNSFVGGNANQQNWVSSTGWEPTSADSTDCWTSQSYSREDLSPVGFQRHAISDFASGINEESERKLGKGGVAPRARTMAGKGPTSSTPKTAAASM